MLEENEETAKLNQESCSGAAGAAGAVGEQEQRCHGQAAGGGGVAKENVIIQHNNNSQVTAWLISLNRLQYESLEKQCGGISLL